MLLIRPGVCVIEEVNEAVCACGRKWAGLRGSKLFASALEASSISDSCTGQLIWERDINSCVQYRDLAHSKQSGSILSYKIYREKQTMEQGGKTEGREIYRFIKIVKFLQSNPDFCLLNI